MHPPAFHGERANSKPTDRKRPDGEGADSERTQGSGTQGTGTNSNGAISAHKCVVFRGIPCQRFNRSQLSRPSLHIVHV